MYQPLPPPHSSLSLTCRRPAEEPLTPRECYSKHWMGLEYSQISESEEANEWRHFKPCQHANNQLTPVLHEYAPLRNTDAVTT